MGHLLRLLIVISLTSVSTASLPGLATPQSLPILRTVALSGRPRALVIDQHTNRVFVASAPGPADGPLGQVTMLDAMTGVPLHVVPVSPSDGPVLMAVDERAGHVFVVDTPLDGHVPGTITMLDATSGRFVRALSTGIEPEALVVDAHAGRLFVSGTRGLAILDTHTGALLRLFDQLSLVGPLAVDDRRQRGFVTGVDNQMGLAQGVLWMLDVRTGSLLQQIDLGSPGFFGPIIVDQQSDHLFLTTRRGVLMLDATTGKVLHVLAQSGRVVLSVDEQASRALIVNMNQQTLDPAAATVPFGTISLLNTRSGAILHTVVVGRGTGYIYPCTAMRYVAGPGSPVLDMLNGRYFIANTRDGTVSSIAVRSGKLLYTVFIGDYPTIVAIDARRQRVFVTIDGSSFNGCSSCKQIMGQVRVLTIGSGAIMGSVRVGIAPQMAVVDEETGHLFVANVGSSSVSMLTITAGQIGGRHR